MYLAHRNASHPVSKKLLSPPTDKTHFPRPLGQVECVLSALAGGLRGSPSPPGANSRRKQQFPITSLAATQFSIFILYDTPARRGIPSGLCKNSLRPQIKYDYPGTLETTCHLKVVRQIGDCFLTFLLISGKETF